MAVPDPGTIEKPFQNAPSTEGEHGTLDDRTERQQEDAVSSDADDDIPDGGYGWMVVLAGAIHTFWINAWTGSFGIFQLALLETTLKQTSSSTLSFVGSLGLCLSPALCVPAMRAGKMIGARWAALVGIVLYGVGNIASGSAVSSVPGLFLACGFIYGLSTSLLYAMANALPVQWFSSRLGTANGLVKLGGGIGATVMAVVTGLLIDQVGVAWTFRIFGFASLATGVPAAFLIRERAPLSRSNTIDWSLFKDLTFTSIFLCGAFGMFSTYTPSFFLPYMATSLGASSAAQSGIVACFNACMAVGRLGSGFACDRYGTMNILILSLVLNTITSFALWSVSYTYGILIVFSVLNGLANGAFFVAQPTAIARLEKDRAAAALALAITGWSPGLLVGNPIAGALIDVTNADVKHSIVPYRPAIFYAGGMAVLALGFAVFGRLRADRSLLRRI